MTHRYERCRLSICVCVGGIYLSDGGDYMGDGLLNRKAERAEFILNTTRSMAAVQSVQTLPTYLAPPRQPPSYQPWMFLTLPGYRL
jgi:hypothetical protein